jgi:hypothetical protein
MHRLALFAIIALFVPTHAAAQCGAPDFRKNTACFDPDAGMPITPDPSLPSGRYRVFSLNGRTNDKFKKPNVFWVTKGSYSTGNVEGPKLVLREYIWQGPQTILSIHVDRTYGTQVDVVFYFSITFRDHLYRRITPENYYGLSCDYIQCGLSVPCYGNPFARQLGPGPLRGDPAPIVNILDRAAFIDVKVDTSGSFACG